MNPEVPHTKQESSHRQSANHLERGQAKQPASLKTDEVVHDLMNLLAGIRMFAESALGKLPLKSPVQGMMEQVLAASREAGELCSSLRVEGRASAQHRREYFNLSALVEDAKPLLKASLGEGTALRFELSTDTAVLRANPDQVRQVLMNLVLNATQALEGKAGEVVIASGAMDTDEDFNGALVAGKRVTGRHLFLEVSDNGCGMNEMMQKNLFEPYFTTKPSGHGVGMSAVLRIIVAHGGAIHVRSAPGAGSRIRVLLPFLDPSETLPFAQSENASGLNTVSDGAPFGTVLLIDDDRTIRMLGETLLKSRGWSVMTTASGEEAVELVRQRHSEILAILLDVMLVGMNGVETFRQLRQITPSVPVIVLSGTNQEELESHFGRDLPQAFLPKPFSIDVLIETLHSVLTDIRGTSTPALDDQRVGEMKTRRAKA